MAKGAEGIDIFALIPDKPRDPNSNYYKLSDEEYYNIYYKHKDGSYDIPPVDWHPKPKQEEPKVGFWRSYAGALRSSALGQAVLKTIQGMGWDYDEDPFQNFDVDVTGYEDHANWIANSRCSAEVEAKKQLVDSLRNEAYLAANGHGLLQWSANNFLTPEMLAAGPILKTANIGLKLLPFSSKFAKFMGLVEDKWFSGTTLGRVAWSTGKGATIGAAANTALVGADLVVETPFRDISEEEAIKTLVYGAATGGALGGFFGAATARVRTSLDKTAADLHRQLLTIDKTDPRGLGEAATAEPLAYGAKIGPGMVLATSNNPVVRNLNIAENFLQYRTPEGKTIGANPLSGEGEINALCREGNGLLEQAKEKCFDELAKLYSKSNLQMKFELKGNEVIGYRSQAYNRAADGLWCTMLNGDDASILKTLGYSEPEINIIQDCATKFRGIVNKAGQYGIDNKLFEHVRENELSSLKEELKALKEEKKNLSVLKKEKKQSTQNRLTELEKREEELNKKIEEIPNKKYTVEDLIPKGAKSFMPIDYLRDKIAANREDFLKQFVRAALAKHPELTREELNSMRSAMWDHVTNTTPGTYLYNLGGIKRSFERERIFDIDYTYLSDYIETDPFRCIQTYINGVYTDGTLNKRLGTFDSIKAMELVDNAYQPAIDAAKVKGDLNLSDKLISDRNKERNALFQVINRLRGSTPGNNPYAIGASHPNLKRFGQNFSGTVNNLTVASKLGTVLISSLSDIGTVTATVGFKNMFRGFKQHFVHSKADKKLFKDKNVTESWLRSISRTETAMKLSLEESISGPGVWGWLNRQTKKIANLSVHASLIPWWDNLLKQSVGHVSIECILNKSFKKAQMQRLGIFPEMYERIQQQFKNFGKKDSKGNLFPNTLEWTDFDAKETFISAVNRIQNQAVITPGAGTLPMLLNDPYLAPFRLFKSFAFAAYSKCLVPAIQSRDMDTFIGVLGIFFISTIKTQLKAYLKDREMTYDEVIEEAINSSDFMSFMPDVMNVLGKMVGVNTRPTLAEKDFIDALFGAPGQYAIGSFQVARAIVNRLITGEPLTNRQVHLLRTLLPLQNNFMLMKAFDAIEKQFNTRGSSTNRR